MFQNPAFPQVARRSYRDIPAQYDRMGQMMYATQNQLGGFPGGFQGIFPAGADGSNVALQAAACGTLPCCPVPTPTNAYERLVGLPRVCVDACDCETIETSVCGPFTLMGLYIAPKVAHHLSITRLQVGCHNLLVNCDPIPAEVFACCEILGETTITAPTVDANSPICLEVENESKSELEFKGALYGLLCLSCP